MALYAPTHVVVAVDAALEQYIAAGGQPARYRRYAANCETLISGMTEMGIQGFPGRAHTAPIIVTFHAPGPEVRVQAVLRRGQKSRFHSLSWQADATRDVPSRMHRRHRPGGNAPRGQCRARQSAGVGDKHGQHRGEQAAGLRGCHGGVKRAA
jgi:hypothetical protein